MKKQIIASLTTYGKRINSVHLTLNTILKQTLQPDKIILWLSQNEFAYKDLPKTLKQLENDCLEIKFCENMKSYKKLIPTLELHPNSFIVTFDDDILYKKDIVEKLLCAYENEPNVVHCMRGHKMSFKNNLLNSYYDWDLCCDDFNTSKDIFPTSGGGTLYFPECFDEDITRRDIFMKLAPTADDVWFKAMTIKKGVLSKIIPQKNKEYMKVATIADTQQTGLTHQNSKTNNGNDKQIYNVFKYYDLFQIDNEFTSSKYWENRYISGNTSGSGSYGKLAKFKAEVINNFIQKNGIETVLEFGCGDGNNLSLYNMDKYIGTDISKSAISLCKQKFRHDLSKKFFHLDNLPKPDTLKDIDMVLSLDVIYHLVEDNVFEAYMNNLFSYGTKYILIYSSDFDQRTDAHVKHRKFTKWIEHHHPQWNLFDIIENQYPFDPLNPNETSNANFYFYKRSAQSKKELLRLNAIKQSALKVNSEQYVQVLQAQLHALNNSSKKLILYGFNHIAQKLYGLNSKDVVAILDNQKFNIYYNNILIKKLGSLPKKDADNVIFIITAINKNYIYQIKTDIQKSFPQCPIIHI